MQFGNAAIVQFGCCAVWQHSIGKELNAMQFGNIALCYLGAVQLGNVALVNFYKCAFWQHSIGKMITAVQFGNVA